MASTVGLEQRGVTFGVHDFRGKRTPEEYHQLLAAAGDSRNRILGVGGTASTFNARSRARSYGAPGFDPKGEYVVPRKLMVTDESMRMREDDWPQKVLGGYGFAHRPSSDENEQIRKTGSLDRNIVGNCTIKDDYHVYYGHGGHHYGNNSGTRNTGHWKSSKK
eukprot:gnl/TRDRNA2_/TRDRNA2_179504_c0_seq1.p2 gnl/TRDRNA2_/TRDRNA2_179504_c0~~gnl/TRDRNA2_/TRDRNA2_179504_c0_seq1.p2  ORF type:complete len:163 (+),score=26.42 gnl/TRDRNA2_/TRDRNA2_179504_c0_seq1:91-579(+)